MSNKIHKLAHWRKLLFRGSIVASFLGAVAVPGCWKPFPLISMADGGYRTNPLDETVFLGSVSLSLLTVTLAFFGRGLPRFSLITIGLFLLLLSIFGFVSNQV
jgi:hypothetical protein